MGFRDRFYTPATARAMLSWRLAVPVVSVPVLAAGFDLGWPLATVTGLALYGGTVYTAVSKDGRPPRIDPFTVGEPWRQFVQGAQRSGNRLRETVEATDEGPLRARMQSIVDKLDQGLHETWRIARRGDQIDTAVRRLDPTALQSKLVVLEQQRSESPDAELDAAIASVESQIASTQRLNERSTKTANTLRLTQARLDELSSRATEVSIGAGDTDAYEHDVEDLVIELEALRLAIEETNKP